ncbi:peptidase domain-containing ABC transporter [Coxiella burnetii]|uniref:peptidase domain-containing ABC transporter n=1 Tax=Coxiella burnetii TaxID=777 RepID=UPI000509C80F|nr:ATP-binding cassette domain-containing protein [Coxiella burnetii]AIT64259.1 Type I protein secretion ATP-binding protein [Coxiella burnetii str. Namibia]PHH57924.1 hypothetical protein CRH12_02435 [Coxiella burnetii]
MLTLLFDIPVAILFLFVVAFMGGTLTLVPIFIAVLFTIFILLFYRPINNRIKHRAYINSEKNHFLLESMDKMVALKYTNASPVWVERYKNLLAESTFLSYRLSMLRDSITAISEWVILIAGFLIIGFGVLKFFHGTLTMGALIAVMILTWRILTPFRSAFVSITRIGQIQFSIRQLSALSRLPHETPPYFRELVIGKIEGQIRFSNVTFRYSPQAKPAVFNLTFNLPVGSMTAVTGSSGSGKTTLLKLIFGLYAPQAGMIQIDGEDVSQANLLELRRQIGYVAEEDEFFYGTIEQNLRLANPLATDEDIRQVLDLLNLTQEINAMPEALQTRIRDKYRSLISPSIQNRLSVARALLMDTPILLLDQPGAALDKRNDQILMDVLKKYHRKKTIVLVTVRPSHMRLADRVMVLEQGRLMMAGKPSEIIPKIMADIQ